MEILLIGNYPLKLYLNLGRKIPSLIRRGKIKI
jgi:hypothetical protein